MFGNFAIGQSIPPQYPNKMVDGKKEGEWVVWFDAKWDKTDVMDSVVYYRKIIYKKGKPDGMVNDFFRSGVKQWEGKISEYYPTEKYEGLCIWYYESGRIMSKKTFINGTLNGYEEEYYDSGKLKYKFFYEDGKLFNYYELYYEDGSIFCKGDFNNRDSEICITKSKRKININFILQSYDEFKEKSIESYYKGDLNKCILDCEMYLESIEFLLGTESIEYIGVSIDYAIFVKANGAIDRAYNLISSVLKVIEKTKNTDSELYGVALNTYADIQREMGIYSEAYKNFANALIETEKSLGTENIQYGTILNNFSILCRLIGECDKSVHMMEKSVALAKKYMKDNDIEYYGRMMNYADALTCVNETAKAEDLYKIVIKKFEEILGVQHLYTGIAYTNYGILKQKLLNYDESISYFNKAHIVYSKFVSKDHIYYVSNQINLLDSYIENGNSKEAEKLVFNLEYSIQGKFEGNPFLHAKIANTLGEIQSRKGNFKIAEDYYNISKNILINSNQKELVDFSIICSNLGLIYLQQGDFKKAENEFSLAQSFYKNKSGKISFDFFILQNNWSVLYYKLGNIEKSHQIIKTLLDSFEINGLEHNIKVNTILLNYANSLTKDINNLKEGGIVINLYNRIISNLKNSRFKSHPTYFAALLNKADVLKLINPNQNFSKYYLDILELIKKSKGEENQIYVTALITYANYLITSEDDFITIEKLYLDALSILKKIGVESYLTAQCYIGLTICSENNTSIKNGNIYLKQANTIIISLLESSFSFMTEEESVILLEESYFFINYLNSYHKRNVNYNDKSLIERYMREISLKSKILDNKMKIIKYYLDQSEDLERQNKFEKLISLLNKKSNSKFHEMDENSDDNEIESLEKELTKDFDKKAIRKENINFNNIRNNLEENQVLIELSYYRYIDEQANETDSLIYEAIIVRKNKEFPIVLSLFEEKRLDSILFQHDNSIADVSTLYRKSDPLGSRPISNNNKQQLYHLIWKPLEPYLNKGDKIYYCPSGKLNYISFASIANSDSTYISDDYQLYQVSSTAKIVDRKEDESLAIKDIAMYGGIDFDANTEKIKTTLVNSEVLVFDKSVAHDSIKGVETWPFLAGTKSEVENITSLAKNGKIRVQSYSSHQATEESYKNLQGQNSPSILHLATHGFFYSQKKRSKNDLDMMSLIREPFFTYDDNPLNRSGLLFAGGNQSWQGKIPEDREDGILTAFEASNVYLPNTRLAVLSACETGLGDIKGSEGVYGMQRALKMAGVEYLLMSLWEVPDAATSEYMTIFYEDLFINKNIETAYQKAQKDMKKKYPHEVEKWGGFVLVR